MSTFVLSMSHLHTWRRWGLWAVGEDTLASLLGATMLTIWIYLCSTSCIGHFKWNVKVMTTSWHCSNSRNNVYKRNLLFPSGHASSSAVKINILNLSGWLLVSLHHYAEWTCISQFWQFNSLCKDSLNTPLEWNTRTRTHTHTQTHKTTHKILGKSKQRRVRWWHAARVQEGISS